VRHNAPELLDWSGGEAYARKLEAEILAADRIVLTEHSYAGDFQSVTPPHRWEHPQLEYDRVELIPAARRQFAERVGGVDKTTKYMSTGCEFAPHHTISFYRDGHLSSTMEICFLCSEYRWDEANGRPPQELITVLERTLREAGMHVDGDHDFWTDRVAHTQPTTDSPVAE
jgi:hypothetical protein